MTFRCQVECDPYCRDVIRARVAEGHFGSKNIPTFEDVLNFSMSDLPNPRDVDGLQGGFPCQARSCAVVLVLVLAFFCSTLVLVRAAAKRARREA